MAPSHSLLLFSGTIIGEQPYAEAELKNQPVWTNSALRGPIISPNSHLSICTVRSGTDIMLMKSGPCELSPFPSVPNREAAIIKRELHKTEDVM
jgi:hypothetical protein